MFKISTDWNPKQAKLKSVIAKYDSFDKAMALAIELHSLGHAKEVTGGDVVTFADEVLSDVSEECFREITHDKGRTIAYNIWHITRIEDICSSILIANGVQIINTDNWISELDCTITDTGNALSAEEIADFSRKINKEQLLDYRIAVGKNTQKILKKLQYSDLKQKPNAASLQRIIDENAVSTKEEAIWLIDFWKKKNVAGLIQMPLTRHLAVHLNDCLKIKAKSIKAMKSRKI